MSDPWRFKIGKHTIICDYEMVPILARFTWHIKKMRGHYYAVTNVSAAGRMTVIGMHRLLTGLSSKVVDHINRNGLDNRLENLRLCNHSQNQANRSSSGNKFGYKGVAQSKNSKKFFAQIMHNRKKVRIGMFDTKEAAALAYNRKAKELFGEFAYMNILDSEKETK